MTAPQGKGEIRRLLAAHSHRPNKQLGQHFLADPNLVERIVRAARVGPGDHVVEIGAGTGTLTIGLAATGADVVAYEVDPHLEPVLAEALGDAGVDVRIADATTLDLAAELGAGPWTLVANLPYNVGTPLVLDVLRSVPVITTLVVMVQREVADRLAAPPGSRVYGLPSVIAGLHGTTDLLFTVPPQVFVPPPDVESAVVAIRRTSPPPHVTVAERLAAVAFGQRRKMLRRSLSSELGDPERFLLAAHIDPAARPETLTAEDFARLADAVVAG